MNLNLRLPGSLLQGSGAEEMRRAQRDPERHRDLIVRAGGFSAHFVELQPEYQEDMIRRTEHGV